MEMGNTVVRKSYGKDITFKIIEIKKKGEIETCVLKGINLRILADSPLDDLELVSEGSLGKTEEIFNKKLNACIKKVIMERNNTVSNRILKIPKTRKESKESKASESNDKNMAFGRPGKILHIDGDSEYVEVCLKVYRQLGLNVVAKSIPESEQPNLIVKLAKEVKPDIVVITGHDGMHKGSKDYMKLESYRNSKYYVQSVANLRDYQPNYDDLVIFAGACQSCYEAILDAGANFASSPNRVLIHCLDPVFLCEKVAFTSFENIVKVQEVLNSTITGVKGIGGLQTRGKYREGFPKSIYE